MVTVIIMGFNLLVLIQILPNGQRCLGFSLQGFLLVLGPSLQAVVQVDMGYVGFPG